MSKAKGILATTHSTVQKVLTGRRKVISPFASATRVLQSVIHDKTALTDAFTAEASKLPARERGRLRELCSGSLRHYHRLDAELSPLVEREVFLEGDSARRYADDPTVRNLLVLARYQSEHMEGNTGACSAKTRAHAAAACDPSVGGFVDAVLRQPRHGGRKPPRLTAAARLSLPEWLHGALKADAPPGAFGRYAPLLLDRPDALGLNVRPARWSPKDYCAALVAEGWPVGSAAPCALAPHGVLLKSRPRDVASLPGVAGDGNAPVFVQDAVQQWGVAALAPFVGSNASVLDACAAPGGKARALLHHAPDARITALDRSARKVRELERRLPSGDGEGSAHRVACGDAAEPGGWWDGEPFDAIVLDAPCSATGILRSKPEVKHHQDEASVAGLVEVQARMLPALWSLLRPGGALLYMTCSLLRAENDSIVASFVDAHADAAVRPLAPPPAAAAHATATGVTFFPSHAHAGGYVALLRKAE